MAFDRWRRYLIVIPTAARWLLDSTHPSQLHHDAGPGKSPPGQHRQAAPA
jgi:hypothetical protein